MADDPLDAALNAREALAVETVEAWWADHLPRIRSSRSPWEAAVRGGAAADRAGWAFAGGYQAALAALIPGRDPARPAALCATEASGAHPRAIRTRFREGTVSGCKSFVTLGTAARELYVLAEAGVAADAAAEGRVELALLSVEAGAAGVSLSPMPPLVFVPEIPHAEVRFEGAAAVRLPGDGWADYVRPFRTVEDVHVHGALLAFLLACGARWGWPRPQREEGLALLCALKALAAEDPARPSTALALSGVLAASERWIEALEPRWASAPPADRARWQRDRALLAVAARARAARTARAWERADSLAPRPAHE